ncbi:MULTISPECIES: penicillin-binding protein 1B [Acinetobacter]|jgi:penicillin-binding protein 1B|uniref:Penicillin-binding protein 1B n=2 Tax=Gammaproteobacteria TaxID=1236 RepID=N8WME2_9GAMM|nr:MULTISPECIES: penicillin-binding protein 1B [Acinetobacter]AWD69082.1 penicillin-binding protein 1B [Acinetobacter schindleri]ENV13267.1 penicillin-binding protein 1B [Acinetobacter schindleri NIPH 900]ENW99994.1 penicillin-binding protein 1B [Acinetobacter sp. CIP 101934]MCU4520647.1 penicillin-binding protein 1B [Acinetobacter schindleri]MDP1444872.1 penicillin-binding protein 1B [Acinetobacter schindleri]
MKYERGLGFIALIFSVLVISAFVAFSIYLIRLDNIVRDKFEGQRWDIPAKVFARPMEIYVNAPVSQQDLQEELKLLGYKSAESYTKSGSYVTSGNTLYVHTRGFDFGDRVEPEQILKVSFNGEQINDVSATKPSTSGIARLEPLLIGGIYPQHNEDRVLIKLNKVPKSLIEALIATEDRNFYHHHGVSPRGIARAVVSNITGGKRQGGSTLTQQLVKNFYLSPERTLKRKVNEAFMAMLIELHYDKDEILEAYLNEVNLGQNGNYSINGYGLASQFYFGLPLRELNISQQAFLVGLVQGPSLYNPWRNPETAKRRRDIVLNNMLVMGYLTQEQYETEKARPLNVITKPTLGPARFPDFLDIVRRQLRTEYQEGDITNQGLRIFTTLDPLAQTRIQQSFKNTVANLSRSNPKRLKDLQGAVLVTHPENGELVAAVGSTQDFTGFNRALDAKRQVGSLLKPVIYLTAIESNRYHWGSPIEDSELSIKTDGKTWTPKNYSGRPHGVVPMSQALANSYNLSAVRLAQEFGMSTFINHLKKFGVTSDIPSYPSIYLGAVDMSPMEVMSLYGNFATGGFKYPVKAIRSVVDANGRLVDRYGLTVQPTIDPAYAYILNNGLQQVMSSGTGQSAYSTLPRNLGLAGKSGTTNDTRDSWFAGYSGNYLAVVWLGLDDNKITGLTGSSGALPVWTSVMKQLRQKPVNLHQPGEVQWQWVDRATGHLSAQGCEGAMYIPLTRHSMPNQATACGASHYAPAPHTIDSEEPQGSDDPSDEIGIWIEETETENQRDSLQDTRIISSGSYSP